MGIALKIATLLEMVQTALVFYKLGSLFFALASVKVIVDLIKILRSDAPTRSKARRK